MEDDFVGDFTACNAQEASSSKEKAIAVASSSRMFMYKPDGGTRLLATGTER